MVEQKKILLDKVTKEDFSSIRSFNIENLKQLSDELRQEMVEIVSKTGGHLGAGLGVVELTVALHHVFDTPEDKIIWDTGHQSYPHKILTNRRDQMYTLRQKDGISGFTKRSESKFDSFGTGHSSTSISAGLGMAVASDLNGKHKEIIAVIGDGALSAGMAYEAMNNAGDMRYKMIVILNDNDMSIAPPVGAMSNYLSKLISSTPYVNIRNCAKNFTSKLPKAFGDMARLAERYAKNIVSNNDNNFFEDMGFYYIGPIDGHNIESLVPVLQNVKDDTDINRPILIHIVTEKGRGFTGADKSGEKFHAVSKFNMETGEQVKSISLAKTYTQIYSDSLIYQAKIDPKILAVTAAMPSGTGLNKFAEIFPDRTFDVGIAEQHAVTFAAGLACEGMKPFVTIYSTFLQRAYDQIIHDVALQELPVRFAIDRAGLVGSDGPTHAGAFDIAYLSIIPNFIIMAPSDEVELFNMVATAAQIDFAPCAFRYPRGQAIGIDLPTEPQILTIGKGKIVQHGNKVAIVSLGTRLAEVKKTAKILMEQYNLKVTIIDARFAKPIDRELILEIANNHEMIITIEEGVIGGFGSIINDFLLKENLISDKLRVKNLYLPDKFIDQGDVESLYSEVGLDSSGIMALLSQHKFIGQI